MRISASEPFESTAVAAIARFCGDTILPMPPPMVLAASRIDGSRPAPAAAVDCWFAVRAGAEVGGPAGGVGGGRGARAVGGAPRRAPPPSTVSLVTVGAFIGVRSLGTLFTDGFQRGITAEVVAGLVATVLLALTIDSLVQVIGWALTPWVRQERA